MFLKNFYQRMNKSNIHNSIIGSISSFQINGLKDILNVFDDLKNKQNSVSLMFFDM